MTLLVDGVEAVATACNIGSNFVMLYALCRDPEHKVPPMVLGLQISANVCWILYAGLRPDPYLAATACMSMMTQVASLVLLRTKRRAIPQATSQSRLPLVPPSEGCRITSAR